MQSMEKRGNHPENSNSAGKPIASSRHRGSLQLLFIHRKPAINYLEYTRTAYITQGKKIVAECSTVPND